MALPQEMIDGITMFKVGLRTASVSCLIESTDSYFPCLVGTSFTCNCHALTHSVLMLKWRFRGERCLQESYEENTKHRKLTWIYSLGMCVVKAAYPKKQVELVVVPFHAVILLLFNSGAPLQGTVKPHPQYCI